MNSLSARRIGAPCLAAIVWLACVPGGAAARWASLDEASATLLSGAVTYEVSEDGTFVEAGEEEILIRNEAGRQQFATHETVYNSRTSRYEVLAAETRVGDRVIPVPTAQIEDKPVASNVSGFDQLRQVTVAFPNAVSGARVYLKYRRAVREVPFPGHFSETFTFGDGLALRGSEVRIRSRKPLLVKVNDPDNVLDVTHRAEDGRDTVALKLKAPAYYRLADETDGSFLHRSQVPHLVVSTHGDDASMVGGLPAAYDNIVEGPFPEAFRDIVDAAAGEKRPVDRFNVVTSMLSERVRYFGDWRPVNGGYVPRPLSAISESRSGDCKDMAVLTAALLRRAGTRADVAFVWRSSLPPAASPLPTHDAFNHAIVRAADNGAVYWIDPTNRFSYAQGIPNDLTDRDALVLYPSAPRLEKIPLPAPETSRRASDIGLRIRPSGSAEISARVDLRGNYAASLTGLGRYASQETLRHKIITAAAGGRHVVSGAVSGFDADSTVVRDMTLDIRAEVENVGIRSTAGMTFVEAMEPFNGYKKMQPAKDRGHYYLGFPAVYDVVDRFKDVRLVGSLPEGCRVDSPWVEASWGMDADATDVILRTRRVVKQQVLTPEDLKSPAFASFQRAVKECLGGIAVVFTPRDAAAR